jgi:hypothetical protein
MSIIYIALMILSVNKYMEIITWILENKLDLVHAVTAVVTAASAIAALTPTPKDNGWIAKAYKLVDWLALNVGKAKDK